MTQDVVVLATQGSLRRFVVYLRRRRGWNQARLAQAVGRSQQWVSKFERGMTEPSLADVLTALNALGADVAVRRADASRGGDADG